MSLFISGLNDLLKAFKRQPDGDRSAFCLDFRTNVLYNENMESEEFPLTLTRGELEAFNEFWLSITPKDRQILDDLLTTAKKRPAAVDQLGRPIPYQAYLLGLLIEEHKEVIRLRQMLEA